MRSAARSFSRLLRRNVALSSLSAAIVAAALLTFLMVGLALAATSADPFTVAKDAQLTDDVNGDGLAGPGDTLTYRITISNSGSVVLQQLVVSDTIPQGTGYVLGSTVLEEGTSSMPVADDTSGTPFPLDEGGLSLSDLAIGEDASVSFQAMVDDPFPGAMTSVRNVASGVTPSDTITAAVVTLIHNANIDLAKTASADFVTAGELVTYTYAVSNTGTMTLTAVVLTDDVCSGITFTGGDTSGDDVLDPGELWIYTCAMTLDLSTYNSATVSAEDPLGFTVTDTASAFVEVGTYFLPALFGDAPPPCGPPDGCPMEGLVKGIGVHSGTGYVYIASRAGNGSATDQILKVDPGTGTIVASAPTGTGSQPWGVVVNENTNRVYVSNFGSDEVVVFDSNTMTEVARISIPADGSLAAEPGRLAILPALDTVFVIVRGGSRIGVIEGLSLMTVIPSAGSGPWGIAADPVRNYVYVSHRDSRNYSLIYKNGGSWVAEYGPQFDANDGRVLFGLSYMPNTDASQPGLLYSLYTKDGNWYVGPWEPKKSGGNPAILWGQRTPMGVPSGGDVNSADVGGDGIVVNPASGNVFVANTGADSISMLGSEGSTYLAEIGTGDDPFPAAVDPATSVIYVGLRDGSALIEIGD
ncbi:MAG: hypothetical protein ACK2UO_06575 [Caldilineaceae bacterium]